MHKNLSTNFFVYCRPQNFILLGIYISCPIVTPLYIELAYTGRTLAPPPWLSCPVLPMVCSLLLPIYWGICHPPSPLAYTAYNIKALNVVCYRMYIANYSRWKFRNFPRSIGNCELFSVKYCSLCNSLWLYMTAI